MGSNTELKGKAIRGFIWKFAEKGGTQFISVVVQIVLARILSPNDYGLIGYLTIFLMVSDVFIQQGFTTALIQKKNADDTDNSSVFFANIMMSLTLYGILFFAAPYIAKFYREPSLTLITRVLSLNIIIGSTSAVHNALLSKKLEFKKSFIRSLSNIFVYGTVGIVLALKGFGVWALVLGKIAGQCVGTITLWVTVKWHPKRLLSFERLKNLFNYSSKVLGTNLLSTIFNNINVLIIGRIYNTADVAFYQRGQSIPQLIMTTFDGSFSEVLYPTFSLLQNDSSKVKSALRRSVRLSMYICCPLMIGLYVIAEPLTLVLLTEKWLSSVPFLKLTCIICLFWPLNIRIHALNALGESALSFKMSIFDKVLVIISLVICSRYSVLMILYGNIIVNVLEFFVFSIIMKKKIGYSLFETLQDILPSLLIAVVMGILINLVKYLSLPAIVTLVVQILLGIIIEVLLSWVFKIDNFYYVLSILKNFLKGKSN